jgi:hypothetical protein
VFTVWHIRKMPYSTTHKIWINPIFVVQQIHAVCMAQIH